MYMGVSCSFGASLDFMVLIFIACVIYYFLLIDTGLLKYKFPSIGNVSNTIIIHFLSIGVTGDRVGLAITQTLTLTGMLQWGIRQSAEVTNQLMSVERILEYTHLKPEKQPEIPHNLQKDWPQNGKIQFKDVVYRYFAEAEPVLRGLSFSISSKEKIGIVGRTGAGKSSLIGSIFRLALVEGDIFIDDINTASVDLEKLRSKISIIPQDPVLFSGTLRR